MGRVRLPSPALPALVCGLAALFVTTAALAQESGGLSPDRRPRPEQLEVPAEITVKPTGGERTLLPLPEIVVSPNEGVTVGALLVVLFASESKTVRSILAPDVRYNDITGVYPTIRFFDYPTAKQKYSLVAGKATKRGDFFEADYAGQDLFDGWFIVRGNARRDQDPFERFFGFGNDTPDSNETNYTATVHQLVGFGAVNLPASFQASLQARVRHVRIGQGGVSNVDQLRSATSPFNTVKGVEGATIVGPRFGLSYDSRDLTDIPSEGAFAEVSMEVIDKALGSTSSFIHYGLEGKVFMPLRPDKKYVVAVHTNLDYLQHGDNAPFYERSTVGGIHTLRGYGTNRFTDNHRFVLQGELRTDVYRREVFGVNAHLELAPFVDLAQVFNNSREFPLEHLHPVGGVGVRAVVVPQVVAYVDVGTAGGGPAVFTGIDYPF